MDTFIKPIKLVIWDLDDTLAEGKIWKKLTEAMGWSWEVHRSLYESRLAGNITYAETHARVVSEYKKSPNANKQFLDLLLGEVALRPYAAELFALLNSYGIKNHILSGGFETHVSAAAWLLKADGYDASRDIAFDDAGRFENILGHESDRQWKAQKFTDICNRYGVSVDEVVVVGDGENDIEIFKLARYSIAIHTTDPLLLEHAWKEVKSLQEIPTLLGIKQTK